MSEPCSDTQLYIRAETMVVARFGVDAVYAELQHIRNDTRKAVLAAKDARIAELTAQLAEMRDKGHWPMRDTAGGVVNYPDPVTRDWDTPEEDEAWKDI